MKRLYKIVAVVAVIAAAGFTAYNAQNDELQMSSLAMDNIEALATPEQPDVNDCIEDPDYDCEALHPTDPSKDKRRNNARW